MRRSQYALVALPLVLVVFVAVSLLADGFLQGLRLDLTAGRLYTLSPGARNIAGSLEEPIRLRLFFAEDAARDLPQYRSYAQRVQEFLEEFAAAAAGRIEVECLDPEPFSEAEDEATEAGLAGLPVDNAGTTLYLGLVGTNSVDDREVIPFLDPEKEPFLEYDVARLVWSLAHPEKRKVALLSSLPIQGGFDPANPGRPSPPWFVVDYLRSLFDVQVLAKDATEIPEDAELLLLVHPKGLSQETLYAIDQFVLGGGKLVAFLDPHCESDQSGATPGNPLSGMGADRSSDLDGLLAAWGVEWPKDKIAADIAHAQRVRAMSQQGPAAVDYVAWLALGRDALAVDHPITGNLERLNLATPGYFRKAEGAEVDFEPLLRTSDQAMALAVDKVKFFPDPGQLLAEYAPGGESLVLAALVSGRFHSAFPDGPPGAADEGEDSGDETAAEDGDGDAATDSPAEHLAEAPEERQVLLVADADLLADRFWNEEERFGPISLGRRLLADNGDFVANAVEMLLGDENLLSLRGRSRSERPFTVVQELERRAQAHYEREQRAIQEEIRQTEQRINELQREQGPSSELILSAEQRAELERLQEKLVDARRRMREVQHELRKDIERLGNDLFLLNLLAMPVVVVLASFLVSRRRRSRRLAVQRKLA